LTMTIDLSSAGTSRGDFGRRLIEASASSS